MKKNQTVQGTFSKIFGKKHASPAASSLYATNPPWIFAQEAPDEGARVLGKRARGARGPRVARPPPRALGGRGAEGKGHVGTCGPAGREGAAGEGGGAERASLGKGCGGKRRGRRGPPRRAGTCADRGGA